MATATASKVKAEPSAATEMEAAQADLQAAERTMAEQDAVEHRLLAENPGWAQNPHHRPELLAAREAYNAAYRAAAAARERIGLARQAERAREAQAARLSLPAARKALEAAQAALAALEAEQAGLAVAQRAAAQGGDVDDLAGVLARRDQLPHKLMAAQMAVYVAQEQVLLGEADELDASVPALRQAVEDTVPALEAAKATHEAAKGKVELARGQAEQNRGRAREVRNSRRRLIEDLSRDRGPVVRSIPHGGGQ